MERLKNVTGRWQGTYSCETNVVHGANIDSGRLSAQCGRLMKPAFKWMMIMGGLLMMGGPPLGMLGTVMGMTQSFEVLGSSGVGDPEQLSAAIGDTLMSTAVGMAIGFAGVALFLLGLICWLVSRNKKPTVAPAQQGVTPAVKSCRNLAAAGRMSRP